jgi:C4-dicarboxylate-specific signal transduction histidine kinase
MPVMDGFTLCREIRKNDKLKHIPLIFYTATYTGAKDEEFAEKIGANAFLIKPADPRDIMDTLERVLEQSKNKSFEIPVTTEYEQEVQKLYSERLVRKLEQKMLEAEQEALARKQAMKVLHRNERLLKATQRVSNLGGWEWEVAYKKMYWTDQVYLIFDLDLGKYKGVDDRKMFELLMQCYDEADRKKIKCSFVNCRINAIPYSIEGWITTSKGNKKYICTAGSPITKDGKVTNVYGYFQDITKRKYAEMKENELNEQLSQAQKLITIGQLAGGVAHDFNNILTVIMGNAEIALSQLSPDNPIKADIDEIMKAGKRASNLTKQLLTFSRKQIVKPEPYC